MEHGYEWDKGSATQTGNKKGIHPLNHKGLATMSRLTETTHLANQNWIKQMRLQEQNLKETKAGYFSLSIYLTKKGAIL